MHPKKNCSDSRPPKSNTGYWSQKLQRNVARDAEHVAALKKLGWRVLIIWDCETTNAAKLSARLDAFLRQRSVAGH